MEVKIKVDDLDGKTVKDVQTVRFSDTEGNHYEIDLSPAHARRLRRDLAPFVNAARKARQPARLRVVTRQPNAAEVRAWAKAQGYKVSDKGRVPDEYYAMFKVA